jgi:hypothetical protein
VLTGESFPVEKKPGVVAAHAGLAERTNCVFMGASVRSGAARTIIIQTGADTALLMVTVVALVIPYLPFAPLLGFTPLPPIILLLLVLIHSALCGGVRGSEADLFRPLAAIKG